MTSHPITENDDRLVVTLLTEDELAQLDDQTVPVSAEKGIQARMGEDEDGTKRIAELHFLTQDGWTRDAVDSFLAENGLDDATQEFSIPGRPHFERGLVEADEADIEETDDWWIIRDNVVTQNGVYNGLHRPPEVLEDNWRAYEGVFLTHGHPEKRVRSMDEVAGLTENARLDRVQTDDTHPSFVEVRVLADYKLAKHTDVDGLRTTDELVEKNQETVDRLRAGEGVDNSQGYVLHARREEGTLHDREYQAVAEEWVPDHVALLLDTSGACPWEDGCGVARLGLDQLLGTPHRHGVERLVASAADHLENCHGHDSPPNGEPTMSETCEGDCNAATRLDRLESEHDRARAALDTIADKAGLELDDELGLGAATERVATHLDTELEDLQDYRQAEQDRKRELAETCADHRIELGADEDERDELVDYYMDEFSTPRALREHAIAIDALAQDDAEVEADTSSRRLNGAATGDQDEETASTSSPGPGVPETPSWEGS